MLAKLALRNVRRSARDYAIYFVTIVFGVAVFYAFNSIESQQILFDAQETESEWLANVQYFLTMFSGVVAVVLGFLVVYANRFLIRRRKHEFGTYKLLGMGPGRISRLVLYETVIVGLVSLAAGLALGFALSQGLSFATAALMGTMMNHYRFVFSMDALVATLACFAIIFAVVALLNLRTVSREKLVDLLQAQKKGERVVMRSPWACLVVFVASVAILAVAYKLLIDHGMVMMDDPRFYIATALMLVGTLLFFWSLAGFVTTVLRRIPGVYLKGLTAFTVRQVSERVNTAFMSLWAVCVLLFFSVTVFSCGMGFVEMFAGQVREAAPYDVSMRVDYHDGVARTEKTMAAENPEEYAEAQKWDFDALAKIEAEVPGWDEVVADAAQLDIYEQVDTTYADIMAEAGVSSGSESTDERAASLQLKFTGLSQFNATAALLGQDPLELGPGECAVSNVAEVTDELSHNLAAAGARVEIAGYELSMIPEVPRLQWFTEAIPSGSALIVVPDEVIASVRAQGTLPYYSFVNAQYASDSAESDAFVMDAMSLVNTGEVSEVFDMKPWPVSYFAFQSQMLAQAGGLRLLVTYLAIYIGFVFLVATAAVLAIQQLTGTSDSLVRYRQLSRLGCDERAIMRSLLAQTCLYFLLPLGLALCHAACAIGVLEAGLFTGFGVDVLQPIVLTASLLVVIYGGYLAVTYLASRAMVRSQMA